MDWYLLALKKYTQFSGRSTRQEYWMFLLFNFIFLALSRFIDYMIFGSPIKSGGFFSGLYSFGLFIPSIAIGVRRLHDIGKSGWMLLISLIPFIGAIYIFVLSIRDGDANTNEYGANPKMLAIR